MSPLQLSRSKDLQELRDDGYDISVLSGHLVVSDVPYVTTTREVARGTLISVLTLAGNETTNPGDHVIYFKGETPCRRDGTPLNFINASDPVHLTAELIATHTFSSKPDTPDPDYFAKITRYVAQLENQAKAIDPTVTAKTFPVIAGIEEETVFRYLDTASTRARISSITDKLRVAKIAIVGLGGTGSYILDLVAKTPVGEIHLYDGDGFLQHNAFRAPGAPSLDDLRLKQRKVDYLFGIYDRMRTGIVPHHYDLNLETVEELRGFDFVFLAIDTGNLKKALVKKLEEFGISFVDVGLGVFETNNSLGGIVRTTTSVPSQRSHIWTKNRIPFPNEEQEGEYDQNIQIADLNALNAAMAVIKWKKLLGFYVDLEREHFSAYTIDGNHLVNEDQT
jgi:hypothetical protein